MENLPVRIARSINGLYRNRLNRRMDAKTLHERLKQRFPEATQRDIDEAFGIAAEWMLRTSRRKGDFDFYVW